MAVTCGWSCPFRDLQVALLLPIVRRFTAAHPPYTAAVIANLEHRHSYVRKNAVLALAAIFHLPKGELLAPDAPELVERMLQNEQVGVGGNGGRGPSVVTVQKEQRSKASLRHFSQHLFAAPTWRRPKHSPSSRLPHMPGTRHRPSALQDLSTRRNAFVMLAEHAQDKAVSYLFQQIDRVADWGDILQIAVLDLIRKVGAPKTEADWGMLGCRAAGIVGGHRCGRRMHGRTHTLTHTLTHAHALLQVCRTNPDQKGKYIKIILALLQSRSTAVMYECAVTLVSLSGAPTAVRAAANCFCQLLVSHSDNNVKLIVLDRLQVGGRGGGQDIAGALPLLRVWPGNGVPSHPRLSQACCLPAAVAPCIG